MKSTSLTVGGFNQPSVARFLIELPGNAEKGLSQRFLWFFPRPVYSHFATLEPVEKEFSKKIGKMLYYSMECMYILMTSKFMFFHMHVVETLARLWRKTPLQNDIPNRVFTIPQQTSDEESTFRKKYDETQQKLERIAAMDDLLSGIIIE